MGGAAKLLDALAHFVGALIWPALLVAFFYFFYEQIKRFFGSLSELSFKGAGIEWTGSCGTLHNICKCAQPCYSREGY